MVWAGILTLARAGGGGLVQPPLRFFLGTRRTFWDSLLKFSVPSGASFAQLLVNKNCQGHVRLQSYDVIKGTTSGQICANLQITSHWYKCRLTWHTDGLFRITTGWFDIGTMFVDILKVTKGQGQVSDLGWPVIISCTFFCLSGFFEALISNLLSISGTVDCFLYFILVSGSGQWGHTPNVYILHKWPCRLSVHPKRYF